MAIRGRWLVASICGLVAQEPVPPAVGEIGATARAALEEGVAALQEELSSLYFRGLLAPAIRDAADVQEDEFRKFVFDGILKELPGDAFKALVEAGGGTVSLETVAAMDLHRRGARLFERAWSRQPSMQAGDLTFLVEEAFLKARPVRETRAWIASLEQARAEGADLNGQASLLGNVAGRYLLWGALTHADLWNRVAPEAKETFIAALLLRGLEDPAVAYVVDGALEPPLKIDAGSGPVPRTIAAALPAAFRGRVGFVEAHLRLLEDTARLQAQADALDPGPDVGDVRYEVRSDGSVVIRRGGGAAHAAEFIARMLPRIRAELGIDPAEAARRGAGPEQVEHWKRLAGLGWSVYWAQARDHVRALVRGTVPHPLDSRIAELQALLRGAQAEIEAYKLGREHELTADQREMLAELEGLEGRRTRDQRGLAGKMLSLLCESGAPPELAEREFAAFEGDLRAQGLAPVLPPLLQGAWLSLAAGHETWAAERLKAHGRNERLRGSEEFDRSRVFPESGREALLVIAQRTLGESCADGDVSRRDDPLARALLDIGAHGADPDRACVLRDLRMYHEHEARALFDGALRDYKDSLASGRERAALRSAFVVGLFQRSRVFSGESWARAALVETCELGLWKDASSGSHLPPLLGWMADGLTEEEFADFSRRGLISRELAKRRRPPR